MGTHWQNAKYQNTTCLNAIEGNYFYSTDGKGRCIIQWRSNRYESVIRRMGNHALDCIDMFRLNPGLKSMWK